MRAASPATGVETEYATPPHAPGDHSDTSGASMDVKCRMRADALVQAVAQRVPCMPAARSGYFLANGARVYNDRGHVEYCTGEAFDPLETCAHILAGEQLLLRELREAATGDSTLGKLGLFNINLDYGESGSCAWGCHENYSASGALVDVRQRVLPHLCTRAILSGAGGFDPSQPLRFSISPRSAKNAPTERSSEEMFFHPRMSSYGGNDCHRVQVICGESNRSHLSNYLKIATTAAMVHLANHRREIGAAFQPREPHRALRTFAEDTSLCARVICRNGEQHSALEVQFALLQMTEEAQARGRLPDWAKVVLPLWRQKLSQLSARGRVGVERELDWAIKWSVFDAHCRNRQTSLPRVLSWNDLLAHLVRESQPFARSLPDPRLAVRLLHDKLRVAAAEFLARRSPPQPIWWDELPRVLELRLQLRELDWRYGEVGGGLFERLDEIGALRHRVIGLTPQRVHRAMTHPPPHTRARTRGRIIRRWHDCGRANDAQCDWDQIVDPIGERILHLNRLQIAVPRWRSMHSSGELWLQRLNVAIEHYRRSRFAAAARVLSSLRLQTMLEDQDPTEEQSLPYRTLRYSAWVHARLGLTSGTEFLQRIHPPGVDGDSFFKVSDHLYCYRFLGLTPHADFAQWLAPARHALRAPTPLEEPLQSAIREHLAAWHLWRGELDQVRRALGNASREQCVWRRVRILCILADLDRRRGQIQRAHDVIDAGMSQIHRGHPVLVAEQFMPTKAKLISNPRERAGMLDEAAGVLRDARHRMALTRVLLLRARGCDSAEAADAVLAEVRSLRRRTPALRSCPLMAQILARWDEWVSPAAQGEDEFWGL